MRKKVFKLLNDGKELNSFVAKCKKEGKLDEVTDTVRDIYRDEIRKKLIPESNFFTLLDELSKVDLDLAKEISFIFAETVGETKTEELKTLIRGLAVFKD